MTKLRVGDLCSHCKKGRMELHYSTRAKSEEFGSAIFWKCDNKECVHVLLCNEIDL